MTLFKEMIYKAQPSYEILVDDSHLGYRYVVVSYGQYPCAYVALEKWHPCYEKQYDYLDINCHGGLTYSEYGLRALKKNGKAQKVISNDFWVIGWDYEHYDDFVGFYLGYEEINMIIKNKKWTTQEIVDEAKSVIEQLDFIYSSIGIYA